MLTYDLSREIAILEMDLAHYISELEKAIEANVEFAKTKMISYKIKEIREQLGGLKNK